MIERFTALVEFCSVMRVFVHHASLYMYIVYLWALKQHNNIWSMLTKAYISQKFFSVFRQGMHRLSRGFQQKNRRFHNQNSLLQSNLKIYKTKANVPFWFHFFSFAKILVSQFNVILCFCWSQAEHMSPKIKTTIDSL